MKTEINSNNQQTMMSSREMAEITSKEVKNIHADIWSTLSQLYHIEKDGWDFSHHKNQQVVIVDGVIACIDNRGYISEFLLNRRHSEIQITGYDVVRRTAFIDRWEALESGKVQPRIAAPAQAQAPQETSMNNDILSLARVVAEATASATMKAVIDIVGIQKSQPMALSEPTIVAAPPAPESLQVNHQELAGSPSEFALVSEMSWISGLSDSACRRLVTFSALPTSLTGVERGHLMIHRASFMSAAQTLLDESTPPTGKVKRWQHPEFGGFSLRLKSSEVTPEAK